MTHNTNIILQFKQTDQKPTDYLSVLFQSSAHKLHWHIILYKLKINDTNLKK